MDDIELLEFNYRAARPKHVPQRKHGMAKAIVHFTEILENFADDLVAEKMHPVFKPNDWTELEWDTFRTARQFDYDEWYGAD